jgi:hypothetical protein
MGVSEHIIENSKVFNFLLEEKEKNEIENVPSNTNNLFELIGDCGDEYRD